MNIKPLAQILFTVSEGHNMSTLSALYLSLKRLSEILDPNVFKEVYGIDAMAHVPTADLRRIRVISNIEAVTEQWLARSSPLTLGQLIATDKLTTGSFFTHYGTFFGRNILDASSRYSQGKEITRTPIIWTKLDSFHPQGKLELQVHPENYTTASAPGEMSGKKSLFLLARLTELSFPTLRAQAYSIGQLHDVLRIFDKPDKSSAIKDPFGRLAWHMEVFLNEIDSFSKSQEIESVTEKDLNALKNIPEIAVKNTFAEIIGEAFVPKDWGGEFSDLVSSQVILQGKRVAAAFAFKGPAKFKPLTVADLGKNGDQISRLFAEPVDLVILQHCHQITPAVRDHMRAFATRIGKLRPFCLIDGANSVRIFKAYRKLGFSKKS